MDPLKCDIFSDVEVDTSTSEEEVYSTQHDADDDGALASLVL